MTEELKLRVMELEAKLRRSEEERRAKVESYEQTLAEEHQRSNQREESDAKKRQELTEKNLALAEEISELKGQLAALRAIEDDVMRFQADIKQAKRDNADLKAKAMEDRKNFEEQINDKRRQIDKQAQEVSDLRCQISVLEHKYQHAAAKLNHQDAQTDELTRTQDDLTRTRAQLESAERTLNAESVRFNKDRRQLEEKVEKLQAELGTERAEPSKQSITTRYERIVDVRTAQLYRAMQTLCHGSGAPDPKDEDAVNAFLEAHARASANTSPIRSREDPLVVGSDAPDTTALQEQLSSSLTALTVEKQTVLLRRFINTVQAHIAQSRSFGDTSGFPDSKTEDRATLVNQIAVVSAERDALIARIERMLKERDQPQSPGPGSPSNKAGTSPTGSKVDSSSPKPNSAARSRGSGVGSGGSRR